MARLFGGERDAHLCDHDEAPRQMRLSSRHGSSIRKEGTRYASGLPFGHIRLGSRASVRSGGSRRSMSAFAEDGPPYCDPAQSETGPRRANPRL